MIPPTITQPNPNMNDLLSRATEKSIRSVEALLDHAEAIYCANAALQYFHGDMDQYYEAIKLSKPMYSKMRTIGSKATIFRAYKQHLPAAISTLYLLAKENDQTLVNILGTDLRSKSKRQIEEMLGRVPQASRPTGGMQVREIMRLVVSKSDRLIDSHTVLEVAKTLYNLWEEWGIEVSYMHFTDDEYVTEGMRIYTADRKSTDIPARSSPPKQLQFKH